MSERERGRGVRDRLADRQAVRGRDASGDGWWVGEGEEEEEEEGTHLRRFSGSMLPLKNESL